ncbi:MAG: class IV adenylate cyclase [Desulfurococcales archaeon]|nr:class IV adenylate cyclase [Desulfurococcales archaeon]
MYEVEAKIRVDCDGLEAILEKALELGGRLIGRRREVDIYYQHPCRDFVETDEALRVRIIDGTKYSLTYKGPRIDNRGDIKKRVEIIVEVSGGDIEKLLEEIGFKPMATVTKDRTYVELHGTTVTLDRVQRLGCFVEIEGDNPAGIKQVVEELGVKGEYVKETYAEMIARLEGAN